jgi:hypothetical protein
MDPFAALAGLLALLLAAYLAIAIARPETF